MTIYDILLKRCFDGGVCIMSNKKETLTYDDYVKGIQTLKPEEQLSLIELLSTRLKKIVTEKRIKHSILELEGLGAEIWKGIDVQNYIRKERESWS